MKRDKSFLRKVTMGVIGFFLVLGGGLGVASVLLFGLRAVKLL